MIVEESEETELKRDVSRSKLTFVDWNEKLKWKRILINFLIVLRKNEQFNVQLKGQILVEFFEIDLIILLAITVAAFFINFDAISWKWWSVLRNSWTW